MRGLPRHVAWRRRSPAWFVAATLLCLICLGLWRFRPIGPAPTGASQILQAGDVYRGTTVRVQTQPCPDLAAAPTDLASSVEPSGLDGGQRACVTAYVELHEGPDAGTTVPVAVSETGVQTRAGEDVFLQRPPDAPAQVPYQLYDRDRSHPLVLLTLLFGAVVIGLGRFKGVAALLSLVVAAAILVLYVLPAIIRGGDPLAVAAVGSAAIAFVVLYVTHGVNTRTTVALLGSLAGLAATIVLADVWIPFAKISGLLNEDVLYVRALGLSVDPSALLLAGIVIGALGAVDDVAITQVSAVWEVAEANPSLGLRELFGAGLRVGRDHVGSIVNTLVLAYAGASLPLLLLFELAGRPVVQQLNGEVLAVEIVRTLTGSIGLILAVPVTTWLAAWAADRDSRLARLPTRGGDAGPERSADERWHLDR